MPGSLMLCLQIHAGSTDGLPHFMNEWTTEVNSCLKGAMPNDLVEKGLQFYIYQVSNVPLICLLFPPCAIFTMTSLTRMI